MSSTTRAGALPDPGHWIACTNGLGGGNQELQYYVPEAAACDGDSHMVLTARRDTGTYTAWLYCREDLSAKPEADHFIPRVRCGIDAVENLVRADHGCNNDNRDLLPAPVHVAWGPAPDQPHIASLPIVRAAQIVRTSFAQPATVRPGRGIRASVPGQVHS